VSPSAFPGAFRPAASAWAGDEAAYITGHTIPVDGGTTEVFPIVMASAIENT
jgi:hypothetical protein